MQNCPNRTGRLYEVTAMYPYNLTRQQTEEFIKENLDAFLDILLTTCSYDVDSILMNHMLDDLEEYAKGCWNWEAC